MKPDARDVLFFLGIVVLLVGVYKIYAPAAYILFGIGAIALTIAPFVRKGE